MQDPVSYVDFKQYKQAFSKLQSLCYKDIIINQVGVRMLGVDFMDVKPDWQTKNHKHSFFEFHYVVEGGTDTLIQNTTYRTNQGHFYILPPGTYHVNYQSCKKSHIGFTTRWEFFETGRRTGLENTAWELVRTKDFLPLVTSQPVQDDGRIFNAMKKLLELVEESTSIMKIQLAYVDLLLDISKAYIDARTGSTPISVGSMSDNAVVHKAIQFMEEHYREDIQVSDIAKEVHVSYSHLARLFKCHAGRSVNDCLNEVRMSNAHKLLKDPQKSVEEVAREVGFNSERYFCTLFKRMYGQSPGRYKKSAFRLPE